MDRWLDISHSGIRFSQDGLTLQTGLRTDQAAVVRTCTVLDEVPSSMALTLSDKVP
jgi:hypothetical protein